MTLAGVCVMVSFIVCLPVNLVQLECVKVQ